MTQLEHLAQNRTLSKYSINLNHLYPLVAYLYYTQGCDIQAYKEKASGGGLNIK